MFALSGPQLQTFRFGLPLLLRVLRRIVKGSFGFANIFGGHFYHQVIEFFLIESRQRGQSAASHS